MRKTFLDVISEVEKRYGVRSRFLFAHSFGAVVATSLPELTFDGVVLSAPSPESPVDKIVNHFGSREGSVIDMDGQSLLKRSNNKNIILYKDFWNDLQGVDIKKNYEQFYLRHKDKDFLCIRPTDDEVIMLQEYNLLPWDFVEVSGDHSFNLDRSPLYRLLSDRLL